MKHGLERNWLRLVAVCLVAAFVAACGSKINQSNFDKIENDMTREDVIDILGEATDSSDVGIAGFFGGMSSWSDGDGNIITIQFVNGKVKSKQFSPGSSDD